MKINFVQQLLDACRDYLNNDDLFVSSTEEIERACIDFLKSRGYNVVKTFLEPADIKIKSIKDLIEYFYILKKKYHPEQYVYRNNLADLALAKAFVESRQEAENLSEEEALQQCAAIIKIIFEEEDKFSFRSPIVFGFLGQKNCGWITEYAIKLLNERNLKKQLELEERRLLFVDDYEKQYTHLAGWDEHDIDYVLNSLEVRGA